jgi:sirohydrochlorin cobaltochelatase
MLVSHGSRDPRPNQAMEHLAQIVLTQIQQQQITASVQSPAVQAALANSLQQARSEPPIPPSAQAFPLTQRPQATTGVRRSLSVKFPLVGTACLELSPVPLHQQVIDFGRRAAAGGVSTLRIIPLFLLQGVHVMEDIPAEIRQARQALPGLAVEVCPHLGSHPGMQKVLQTQQRVTTYETMLLLAHGSRRPGGNDPIHAMANHLGGAAAFWAVAPSVEDQVIQMMQNGIQKLAILPYFLFAGSITDAITQTTESLAERFPQITFHLLPPLGPTENLATLVTDLALDRVKPKTQRSAVPLQRTAFRYRLPSPMVS